MNLQIPIIIILISLFFILGIIAIVRYLRKRAVRPGAGPMRSNFAVSQEIIVAEPQRVDYSNRLPNTNDPGPQIQNFLANLEQIRHDIATSFRPIKLKRRISDGDNPPEASPSNNEEENCVICLEHPSDAIFAPCTHRCCCLRDALYVYHRIKTCPICRGPLQGIVSANT